MLVKDFAQEKGVTVQAIYKLLRTHSEHLDGHIESSKGGKFLDEFAMEYLTHRMVGGQSHSADAKLMAENESLRKERDLIQDELFSTKNTYLELKEKYAALELEYSEIKKELDQLKKEFADELDRKLGFGERFFGKKKSK